MGVRRKDVKEATRNESVKAKLQKKRIKNLFTLEERSCPQILLCATSLHLSFSLMSYWPCLTHEESLHLSTKLAPWQPKSHPPSSHTHMHSQRCTHTSPPHPKAKETFLLLLIVSCLPKECEIFMVLPLIGKLLGDRRVRLEVGVGGGGVAAMGTGEGYKEDADQRKTTHLQETWRGLGRGVAGETGRQRWRWWGGLKTCTEREGSEVCVSASDTCLPVWRLCCLCTVTSLSVILPPERRWAAMPGCHSSIMNDTRALARAHAADTRAHKLGYKAKQAFPLPFTPFIFLLLFLLTITGHEAEKQLPRRFKWNCSRDVVVFVLSRICMQKVHEQKGTAR